MVIPVVTILVLPDTSVEVSAIAPPTTPSNSASPVTVSVLPPSTVPAKVVAPVPVLTSVVLPVSTAGPNTLIDPLVPVVCAAVPPAKVTWSNALRARPEASCVADTLLSVEIVTLPPSAVAVRLPVLAICNSAVLATEGDIAPITNDVPLIAPFTVIWLAATAVPPLIR